MNAAEWAQVVGCCIVFGAEMATALAGVLFSIYAFVNDIWGGDSKLLTAMLLPAAILLCIAAAYYLGRNMVRRARKTLRLSWERRTRNTCARCGYCLIGNVSGTCPECGMRSLS
jgi:hypothetical protein